MGHLRICITSLLLYWILLIFFISTAYWSCLQAFASYLAYKRENNELLLFLLRQLASDQLTYHRNRYGGEVELVEIPEEEFADKVCFDYILLSNNFM